MRMACYTTDSSWTTAYRAVLMAKKPAAIMTRTYSTAGQEPSVQFHAWRDYIAPIYDVAPVGQETTAGFSAEVQAWHLGALLIGRSSFAAHRFFRDQHRIGHDNLTHILIQLCLKGGFAGIADGRSMTVSSGEIAVIDLARPVALEAISTRTVDVIIPRTMLDPMLLRKASLSGFVLQPTMPTTALLVDHLLLVTRQIPHLAQEAAPALTQMLASAVNACISPLLSTESNHRSDTLNMGRVKAYLDQHLKSPKLGPADICRDLGISRPTLYRMFAGLGGVAAYIQNQRLAQAYALLADAKNPHALARDVAGACGFVSAAHFHRCFKEAFGVTPNDVRSQQPSQRAFPQKNVSINFEDVWITQLA